MLLFAFNSVAAQNNCREISDPLCKNNPASCVDEQVRSRISSHLSLVDIFFEDNVKDKLPYGCYLTPKPTVPYIDECVMCSQQCDRGGEREEKWEKMCQIYCWEERVRCTTSSVTPTAKMASSESSETSSTVGKIDETIRTSTSKLTEGSMFGENFWINFWIIFWIIVTTITMLIISILTGIPCAVIVLSILNRKEPEHAVGHREQEHPREKQP